MKNYACSNLKNTATAFRQSLCRHIKYSLGRAGTRLSHEALLNAVSLSVRDRLIDRMLDTEQRYQAAGVKRLYYLSIEFLVGRSLINNLCNLGLLDVCDQIVREYGADVRTLEEYEPDAGLGNGGLGRLAACFLDSLATCAMPGFGYGIQYEYGLFRQEISAGCQKEKPDNWLVNRCPWLLERTDEAIAIPLFGRVETATDKTGAYNPMWLDWNLVVGIPSDMPVAGYGGETVNYLRLYTARASRDFDMQIFNEGDYVSAVEQKITSETISKILYPSDVACSGKELRLIQEYFLVACALRDIVRRVQQEHGTSLDRLHEKVAIQLNDTHPALAVAELMRMLVDEQDLGWETAWDITRQTLGYTNHTLMPEALEKWPVDMLGHVLPRHLQILFEINRRFLEEVSLRWPGDEDRLSRMSLIEEGPQKQVRMAHCAVVGSHAVNGVAAIHSGLVSSSLFSDYAELWPEKFSNKTNGISQRRWVSTANPGLAGLLNGALGTDWITDLDALRAIEPLADDAGFREDFMAIKSANKARLAACIRDLTGEQVDPQSLFDVQVKRIHEYKRQLLNVMRILAWYFALTQDGWVPPAPATFVFAGKAAPGYWAAKQIIRLVHAVADLVNRDRRARNALRIVFLPDYRVSLAEIIIPAADVSEQISTAGTEASGTSNMKLSLNGALTIGTLDGATIEMADAIGRDNLYLFGLSVDDISELSRTGAWRPQDLYENKPELARVLNAFTNGQLADDEPGCFMHFFNSLVHGGDPYFHLADFMPYCEVSRMVINDYCDRGAWARRAILTVARMGYFSSDRTIREYARDIWGISPNVGTRAATR
jgi:glycogen phosphorylase